MGTLNMLGLAKRVRVSLPFIVPLQLRSCACSVTGLHPLGGLFNLLGARPLAWPHGISFRAATADPLRRTRKRRLPQARFLLSSTSEVYGDPLQHPQTEASRRASFQPAVSEHDWPLWEQPAVPLTQHRSSFASLQEYWGNVNPIGERSCYDEGKRVAETLAFDYHREHGVEASGPLLAAAPGHPRAQIHHALE